MNQTASVITLGQAVFEVIGFDRVQFVSDVLEAASMSGRTRFAHVSFEADGVMSTGRFIVQDADRQQLDLIDRRIQLVRGLVRVTRRSVSQ